MKRSWYKGNRLPQRKDLPMGKRISDEEEISNFVYDLNNHV